MQPELQQHPPQVPQTQASAMCGQPTAGTADALAPREFSVLNAVAIFAQRVL